MKNPVRMCGILLALLFLSGACAHLSSNQASTEALTATVKKVWEAKLNGDWGVVYDNAVKEYRNKKKKADFLRRANIVVKEYAIKETTVLEPGKRAISVVDYTISHAGFEFPVTRYKEEWLWEDGAWHLNLLPTLKSPMEN